MSQNKLNILCIILTSFKDISYMCNPTKSLMQHPPFNSQSSAFFLIQFSVLPAENLQVYLLNLLKTFVFCALNFTIHLTSHI